jgi:hypothetical protein
MHSVFSVKKQLKGRISYVYGTEISMMTSTNQRENSEQLRAAKAGQQLLREELDLCHRELYGEITMPLHLVECKPCTISWTAMATMDREFLMIPNTSVPISERLFSKAGDVTRKKRSSLKPNKVHIKQFC